ncbi:MAG TPA: basic amino acid ABC transporter substrate-binding protein [Candidatus Deferrimicrobium sp.]|nr:basic amino acid ABC transporter substrate-binding protein [Candidatus Deferrimicrobium sp.]
MRKILFLVLLSLPLMSCGSKQPEAGVQLTILRVGTDATYPPFESVNPATGRAEGFDIDLMTEICAANGWKPEFVSTAFDAIIPGLTAGKYDVVISAMTITPQRAAIVDFSEPYYLAGQSIAVSPRDTLTSCVADLKGKRVGVQLGTTGELMAKKMDDVQVYSYDNIGAAFIDMTNGNLDAVLNDYPTTKAYIQTHGQAKIVGEILSTEHYGIAVRKGDRKLLDIVNRALRETRQSGRFRELHLKWFGSPLPEQPLTVDSTVSR